MNYEIGDTVRIVNRGEHLRGQYHYFPIGLVVTVADTRNDLLVCVGDPADGYQQRQWVQPDSVERVEVK